MGLIAEPITTVKGQMMELEKYTSLDDQELAQVEGGVIPLAIWAIWGTSFAAGFAGGIAVGLNHVNRK